jgi:hypothetical protein
MLFQKFARRKEMKEGRKCLDKVFRPRANLKVGNHGAT